MKLKSFGCSFVFGIDLQDTSVAPKHNPSQKTWPALLAQHQRRQYECHAWAGAGNLQILAHVLNQIPASTTQDLFVISWTWIDRFDYYDSEWSPERKTRTPWNTIMPIDNNDLARTYYRDLHSEYRDKFTCLSYVKLAIDTLDQQGIPFVMTFMDKLMFDQYWHVTPEVKFLQDHVQPRMTDFEGRTFLDWSRHHGFAESETWHPLEQAHQAAAELLINSFDKQKINAPVQQVRV